MCYSVLQITLHVYTFPVPLVHNPAIPCGLIKEICKELIDFKMDVIKWRSFDFEIALHSVQLR